MFENLSDRLERSFKILKGEGKITEINVAETMKDVRRALLDADVNYKVAKEFTNKVKEKALGMNVLTAVKPGQLMIKLVHDELEELMGGEEAPLKLESHPAVCRVRVRLPSAESLPICSRPRKARSHCSWPATFTVRQLSSSSM